jgi:hypothetical protein
MAATRKQPTSTKPQKPGNKGEGDYYHVEVLSDSGLTSFRTQDVGDPGHIQRVAGKRASGPWVTVKWLIGKEDAHVSGNHLVPDSKDARELLEQLGVRPVHIEGDRFEAKTAEVTPDDSPSKVKRGRGTKSKTEGR